ncbi:MULTISPECIES: hypothetical protein [Natrialbaceae]|uniref:hypothetical protein n=1 Tax=Natrialbaceae TaxID=1644061 RepID=UPI00207CEB5A|nr:hypothetical protein [Natronococcus sp. CG52]
MERRTLVWLGLGGGLAALAGWLGTLIGITGADDGHGSSKSGHSADETGIPDSESDEPLEHITIGDADAADESGETNVYLWNVGDDERSIEVHVTRDDETVVERTDTVPSDAYLVLTLLEPGTYETVVTTDGARNETTLEHSENDCGRTVIAFRESGMRTKMSNTC